MTLPPAERSRPRLVGPGEFAQTGVGRQLQSDSLKTEAGTAAKALMWVAIIQTVVFGVLCAILANRLGLDRVLKNPVMIAQAASAGIFWSLFFWARIQPLPAAIVGLALYCTLVALNVINAVGGLSANQPNPAGRTTPVGINGLGIGWLDIVIIAILARAISSGLKYRKLNSVAAV